MDLQRREQCEFAARDRKERICSPLFAEAAKDTRCDYDFQNYIERKQHSTNGSVSGSLSDGDSDEQHSDTNRSCSCRPAGR